jgi:hypothetical protein
LDLNGYKKNEIFLIFFWGFKRIQGGSNQIKIPEMAITGWSTIPAVIARIRTERRRDRESFNGLSKT